METINERSTSWLTITFKDKAAVVVVPATASYRIDCLTTGLQIRGDTALTPASSIEVALTPTDNAIQVAGNAKETRRVTVTATYNAGDEIHEEYLYEVKNLFGVN